MKRFLRWVAKIIGSALTIILVVTFFPHISRIVSDLLPDASSFGVTSAAILSQKMSTSSRLETYTVQEEGVIDHDFLRVGADTYLANVTIHYDYTASFGIDLSKVQLHLDGNRITLYLPEPELLLDRLLPLDTVSDTFWAPHFDEDDYQKLLNKECARRREHYLSEENRQMMYDASVGVLKDTVEKWLGVRAAFLSFDFQPLSQAGDTTE